MEQLKDKQLESKKQNSGGCELFGFGYYETRGSIKYQNNALAWKPLNGRAFQELTNIEIGKRLWSLYRDFDKTAHENNLIGGTAASTTVCTQNSLITATLSDTTSYVIVYKENNEFEVHRLNQRIRHPSDTDEIDRVKKSGREVFFSAVAGLYNYSRAIGDIHQDSICADADIDIFELEHINRNSKVQVITASGGLLNGNEILRNKHDNEEFIKKLLIEIQKDTKLNLHDLNECEISRRLVKKAQENGYKDNVSISVQTVRDENFSFTGLVGVYGGHDAWFISQNVADNICTEFEKMLQLTPEQYRELENSADKHSYEFKRDKPRLDGNQTAQINPRM